MPPILLPVQVATGNRKFSGCPAVLPISPQESGLVCNSTPLWMRKLRM